MCVIAVSPKGIRQPTIAELKLMWQTNPHGAGYMIKRKKSVEIHKGFMSWEDFKRAVESEHMTKEQATIYHFRISTQCGITPTMTHPFPLTNHMQSLKALDLNCDIAVAHNGIIPMTTNSNEKEFSDTALFIGKYMSRLIHNTQDLLDENIQTIIKELINSKMAIMDKYGNIVTIGQFFNHDGILLSNEHHLAIKEFYNWKGAFAKCIV